MPWQSFKLYYNFEWESKMVKVKQISFVIFFKIAIIEIEPGVALTKVIELELTPRLIKI